MITRIEHPCVHYDVIELDILKALDTKRKNFHSPSNSVAKAQNWFPGYTTLSVLLQLEGILHATLHVYCGLCRAYILNMNNREIEYTSLKITFVFELTCTFHDKKLSLAFSLMQCCHCVLLMCFLKLPLPS